MEASLWAGAWKVCWSWKEHQSPAPFFTAQGPSLPRLQDLELSRQKQSNTSLTLLTDFGLFTLQGLSQSQVLSSPLKIMDLAPQDPRGFLSAGGGEKPRARLCQSTRGHSPSGITSCQTPSPRAPSACEAEGLPGKDLKDSEEDGCV
jgi:hypothetical protein